MMLRNFGRRYQPEAPADETKPKAKSTGAAAKRRALGDITNSSAAEETKDIATKKSTVVATSAPVLVTSAPEIPLEIVEEKKQTIEISDRDYMRRESEDIDARDAKNPTLAICYVNEMYDNFAILEKKFLPSATYMTDQPFINERMRSTLVDWLVEVHLKFKMVPETLYLTVIIIDRYLEKTKVRRSKLQLVGVAALLLAAKYEEIYPPELRDLVYIADGAYDKEGILEMESDIAVALDYNLTVPTIHSFLCRHLKAAHADRTMVQLACYLCERTLQEYGMIQFCPSVIAATAVLTARKSLQRHAWSPTLVKYTKYDEPDLVACSNSMKAFLNNAPPALQAVKTKYSSPKFGGVAKMKLTF